MICYVTRYDPETRRAVGEAVVVEAATKAEAVEKVCGFKVTKAGIKSVDRQRRLPQGQTEGSAVFPKGLVAQMAVSRPEFARLQ